MTSRNYSDLVLILKSLSLTNPENKQDIIFNLPVEPSLLSSRFHREYVKNAYRCHRIKRRFEPYNVSDFTRARKLSKLVSTASVIENEAYFQSDYYQQLCSINGDCFDVEDFDGKPGLLLKLGDKQKLSSRSELSCSAQARKPDSSSPSNSVLTVGELAAYLDEFLYIPKKMSFMAENMYT